MVSTVFYYIWNVLSFGLLSAFKVAVRKGIQEQKNTEALAYASASMTRATAPQPATA